MIEVMMSLPSLPAAPAALPPGYRLRPFREGDRRTWIEIQAGTGTYRSIGPELFDREFGDDPSAHAARILFAEADGEAVGVSAAWFRGTGMPAGAGRVHWVAVTPAHQRRGVGRALVVATLLRLAELGCASAALTTGSGNRPAIRLYRSLGFVPAPRSEKEVAVWAALDAEQTLPDGGCA